MESLIDHPPLECMENDSKMQPRRALPLEIDTHVSKTNAFFSTNDVNTPRPPPSISRKLSIRQASWTSSGELEESVQESYASRIRHLVAATRQASVAPAPAPIPQHLSAKKPSLSEEEGILQQKILPLPTPLIPHTEADFSLSQPEEIPVISSLNALNSSRIPTLAEEPTLGDYLESPTQRERHYQQTIHVQDQEIVGKQIGAYRIQQLLGVGAFSKVYIGHHLEADQAYAVKTIQKGTLLNDSRIRSSIEREIGVLKYINHTNIVHLEATMETEQFICIVLEYVEGGELFDFVQKMHYQSRQSKQKIDEDLIKHLFLQLVHAVSWLHEHHIVHRDLKLENILIQKTKETIALKITDFGLARVVDPEAPLLTTRCGSEEYAAPEIVQGKGYDGRKTDVWALGILLYSLLVGYLPFRYEPQKHEKVSQLFYRILTADVKWPTEQESQISPEAKQVVLKLLERNPEKRIPVNEIEHLDWFTL